jgi:hypothetical protein
MLFAPRDNLLAPPQTLHPKTGGLGSSRISELNSAGCRARSTQKPELYTMRIYGLAAFAAAAIVASTAMAQNQSRDKAQDKTVPLPQITIGGGQQTSSGQAAGGAGRCGNLQPGSSQAFDCLNQQLQNQVNGVNPGVATAPIDAKSSDLKVGTVNMPAVKQQYGQNFGVSVIPYRPSVTFHAPLGGR